MKKIAFTLYLIVVLCQSIMAADLELLDISYSWSEACQYYKILSGEETPLIFPTDQVNILHGEIDLMYWQAEKIIKTEIDTPVYEQICTEIKDNLTGLSTGKEECLNGELLYYEAEYTDQKIYIDDIKEETLRAGDPKIIRYCIKFNREFIKDRGYVIEADMIPTLDGKEYIEYAWFNSTYTQKVDLLNDSYNLPTPVNNSAGCNGSHYIARNIYGTNLSQYQNSCTDVAIVGGDTTSIPFEKESTGLNYSINLLYSDAWYINHWGFNETGNASYNTAIQGYDSQYYIRQNVSTGLIGQGWRADGAAGIFVKNSTNTQYTIGSAFGIFTCIKPYNATQWTTSKTGDLFWLKAPANCAFYLDVGPTPNNYAFECSGYSGALAFADLAAQWYCFTATCDGTNCRLYLNDTLKSTFAYSVAEFKFSNFNIGLRRQSEGGAIDQISNGETIDEFMVFTRNLTQADVNHLVKAYLGSSEYMYASKTEFPVYPNVNILSISNASNDTTIQDSTPDVLFKVNAEKEEYDCELYINNTLHNFNASVANNTNFTLYSNGSLSNGGYYFNISCAGSLRNSSEQWFMTISTTTTTTTTTAAATTTTQFCITQNLTYAGKKQLCIKDVNNTETCLNQNEQYNYTCASDYILTLKSPSYAAKASNVFFSDLPVMLLTIGLGLALLSILLYGVYYLLT